jgi:CheY-like chemotaxis protein
MTVTCGRPMLIVEDSPEDFEATVRTLQKSGLESRFVRCEDGDDALDFLYQRGPYAPPTPAPRPAFILLDLNLPGTDGRQILTQIKQDQNLKAIPVVVFTTSDHRDDVRRCFDAGANSYIRKPVDLASFQRCLLSLKDFWFDTAILP